LEENGEVSVGTIEVQPMEVSFLEDVPLRDETLAGVGSMLYLAASPDMFDGLSDAEFTAFENEGVVMFEVLEKLERVGAPENLRLPSGFAEHFKNEVLQDLKIIREDPKKRDEFRKEIKSVLMNKSVVRGLYMPGGTTYSDIATQVAGTNRTGKFYNTESQKRPSPKTDGRYRS